MHDIERNQASDSQGFRLSHQNGQIYSIGCGRWKAAVRVDLAVGCAGRELLGPD